jgi:creatinine amidohydrolase
VSALWLQEQTWQDVETYLKNDDRVIMPVGSTEQHGRFAPLGTDTYVAVTLAEDASDKSGVLIAPPIWTGWSPHHLVCPGTVSVRAEILIELLYDAIRSLTHHGFRGFVVVNGHRIVNIPWMQIAAERAQRDLGAKVFLFDPAHMSKEIADELGFGPIGHADEIEISHMVYRYPHLVHLDQARDQAHGERELYHIDPRDGRDSLCYVPATVEDMKRTLDSTGDTIGGYPTSSSAEKGKRYHEHLVKRLVEVLTLLKDKNQ